MELTFKTPEVIVEYRKNLPIQLFLSKISSPANRLSINELNISENKIYETFKTKPGNETISIKNPIQETELHIKQEWLRNGIFKTSYTNPQNPNQTKICGPNGYLTNVIDLLFHTANQYK